MAILVGFLKLGYTQGSDLVSVHECLQAGCWYLIKLSFQPPPPNQAWENTCCKLISFFPIVTALFIRLPCHPRASYKAQCTVFYVLKVPAPQLAPQYPTIRTVPEPAAAAVQLHRHSSDSCRGQSMQLCHAHGAVEWDMVYQSQRSKC